MVIHLFLVTQNSHPTHTPATHREWHLLLTVLPQLFATPELCAESLGEWSRILETLEKRCVMSIPDV